VSALEELQPEDHALAGLLDQSELPWRMIAVGSVRAPDEQILRLLPAEEFGPGCLPGLRRIGTHLLAAQRIEDVAVFGLERAIRGAAMEFAFAALHAASVAAHERRKDRGVLAARIEAMAETVKALDRLSEAIAAIFPDQTGAG